jgi:hypothetical protein
LNRDPINPTPTLSLPLKGRGIVVFYPMKGRGIVFRPLKGREIVMFPSIKGRETATFLP